MIDLGEDFEEFSGNILEITDPIDAVEWLKELFGGITTEQLNTIVDSFIEELNKDRPPQPGICDFCLGRRYVRGKNNDKLVCSKCYGKIYI